VYKEERTQNYDPGRTSHTYTIFPVTSFSVNYNETEITIRIWNRQNIRQNIKNKKQNIKKPKIWTLEDF